MFSKGERCETGYNPCLTDTSQNQCQNGATCLINFGVSPFYQCICKTGYSGQNCQNVVSTTTAVPFAIPASCDDLNPAACQYYAANNYCSNFYYINRISIPTYCARSCNTCVSPNGNSPLTTARPCVDSQVSCNYWSSTGNCHRLPNQKMCSKSCGLC